MSAWFLLSSFDNAKPWQAVAEKWNLKPRRFEVPASERVLINRRFKFGGKLFFVLFYERSLSFVLLRGAFS
jgi:hypothetical protein